MNEVIIITIQQMNKQKNVTETKFFSQSVF